MTKRSSVWSIRALGLGGLLGGASALALMSAGLPALAVEDTADTQVGLENVRAVAFSQPANLADLVEDVSPAVVKIETSRAQATATRSMSPIQRGNQQFGGLLERFFGDRAPNGAMPQPHPGSASLGSGFLISDSGIIVTNNHVVQGADSISVTLKSGQTYEAELLGTDERTDLAVLKIEAAEELPAIAWGSSDTMRVGESVFAVGAPFGLSGSVTAGIISARGRDIGSGPYDDYLQVDAPINSGNSGGPLFDTNGNVIGVNTAIYSPSGGNVGIGFAIPSDLAQEIVSEIVGNGSVERAWLGVSAQSVNEEMAAGLGLGDTRGAIVAEVMPGSPAATSELGEGDIITAVDGTVISDARALTRSIGQAPIGERLTFSIIRGGEPQELKVTLENLAKSRTGSVEEILPQATGATGPLGLGIQDSRDGVVIAAIAPGSPSAAAGLRPGDVVKAINQMPISKANEATKAIERAREDKRPFALFQIERSGRSAFVTVPLQ